MKRNFPQFVTLESRLHFAAAPWEIWGDQNPNHLADAITLRLNPDDPTKVQAIVNHRTITRRLAGIRSIIIHAGRGNDTITLDLPESTNLPLKVFGGIGADQIFAGQSGATLLGGGGNDTLYGGTADDNISGGDGNDLIYGGDGDDQLTGNGGNDTVSGEYGNDNINGNQG